MTDRTPGQAGQGVGLHPIRGILDVLHAEADANDRPILANVRQAVAERKASTEGEVADLLAEAYIPIDPENGRFLHVLAAGRRAGRIVEFGTSMGLSAIYLAAALRLDEPPVITTELDQAKVQRAGRNIDRSGLGEKVEIRSGDAFETLADLSEPVSLLFLDGWKDLYLPMLKLVEPLLVDGAFVVADDTVLFAETCRPFLQYLRSPASSYTSASLAIGDGMEVACRLGAS